MIPDRRKMPPKLADRTKKVNLILPDDLAKQIDDYRRHQEDMPNVSVAIRRLIEAGLKASPKSKPKK
jgi:hypothetical protein